MNANTLAYLLLRLLIADWLADWLINKPHHPLVKYTWSFLQHRGQHDACCFNGRRRTWTEHWIPSFCILKVPLMKFDWFLGDSQVTLTCSDLHVLLTHMSTLDKDINVLRMSRWSSDLMLYFVCFFLQEPGNNSQSGKTCCHFLLYLGFHALHLFIFVGQSPSVSKGAMTDGNTSATLSIGTFRLVAPAEQRADTSPSSSPPPGHPLWPWRVDVG